MSKQTSALPTFQLSPRDHSIPWHLFVEIVVPAAAIVIVLPLIAIGLQVLNIFEIGLVAVIGILAHALWRSPEAALKQLKFGAQAFVIAGLLSVVPAQAVSVFAGNSGFFSPAAAQLTLVELSLYSAMVFSVTLTFYYWVIFAIWDNKFQSLPRNLWLAVLGAGLLIIGVQIALEYVTNGALVFLLSLSVLLLMFGPPILWILEYSRLEAAR